VKFYLLRYWVELTNVNRWGSAEHVASATEALCQRFLAAVGLTPETDDPENILLDVETQLK
jgi:hypothetical protein